MNKIIFLILTITLLTTSCKKEVDLFLVCKQNIGFLTDSTQVRDLKTIYSNDSIVKQIAGDEFLGNINDINIFEKGGKHLLSLSPKQSLDSMATIRTVKIIDSRYNTKKGIHALSTFGDIKTQHSISRIENTFRSVIIFVNENNTFFTINKNVLPDVLRYNSTQAISEHQIPDTTRIKTFMVGW